MSDDRSIKLFRKILVRIKSTFTRKIKASKTNQKRDSTVITAKIEKRRNKVEF
jgi:hypothetical protein